MRQGRCAGRATVIAALAALAALAGLCVLAGCAGSHGAAGAEPELGRHLCAISSVKSKSNASKSSTIHSSRSDFGMITIPPVRRRAVDSNFTGWHSGR